MAEDLSSLEAFALASASQRQQMLSERHTSSSLEGMAGAIEIAQLKIMEAREAGAGPAVLEPLLAAEDALAKTLRESQWRYQSTATRLLLRHDLLSLERPEGSGGDDRTETLGRLQTRLNIQYSQFAQQLPSYAAKTAAETKPSVLDNSQLDLPSLLPYTLRTHGPSGLTQLASEWLAAQPLSRQQLGQFLASQQSPILSNLVDLVLRELNEPIPTSDPQRPQIVRFGDSAIHKSLTLEQLRALGARKPELYKESQLFVETLIFKGQPCTALVGFEVPERDGGLSDSAKQAYLDELWTQATELAPIHTAIKGVVLFHVLWYNLHLFNSLDFVRLAAYLELPRTNNGSSTLKYRSESDLGFSNLKAEEVLQRRACLFAGPSTRPNVLRGASGGGVGASIFTKLSPENESVLLEAALKRQQLEAGADIMLSKSLASGWMQYVRHEWAERVLGVSALLSAELSSRVSAAEIDQIKSRIGADTVQQLRSRVQLEFGSATPSLKNPTIFRSGDSVSLRVQLKAVPTLIVKTFLIHARNFYTKRLAEIDATSLELDGLTPSEERVIVLKDSIPNFSEMHVYEQTIDFPSLSKQSRGIFVVELLGGGYRARSILRKGSIVALSTHSAQGHLFRLMDEETQRPLTGGAIFLGSQTYNADPKSNLILVPFSAQAQPGQKVVYMGSLPSESASSGASASALATGSDSTFASLGSFDHLSESYSFSARFLLDRESLLAKTKATVLIKTDLTLHGQKVAIEGRLRNVQLRIDMVDLEGVPSSQSIESFALWNDKESTHTFSVPDHLRSVSFTLSAELTRTSNGEKQQLSDSFSMDLNTQELTHFTEDLYLKYGSKGAMVAAGASMESKESDVDDGEEGSYVLYCLGKTGEAVSGRQIRLQFRHEYTTQLLANTPWLDLVTDAAGKIVLGPLRGVYEVAAIPVATNSYTTPQNHRWTMRPQATPSGSFTMAAARKTFVAQEGTAISIPFTGARVAVDAKTLAAGSVFVLAEDLGSAQLGCFLSAEHVSLDYSAGSKCLRVTGLRAGHYQLWCKLPLYFNGGTYHSWNLHVVAGSLILGEYLMDRAARIFVQAERQEVAKAGAKLQIVSARKQGSDLLVQLAGVNPTTRVHLISTNLHPDYSRSSFFTIAPVESRVLVYNVNGSSYLKQLRLGDELNYILDRKLAGERVGNLLPRPSLLLVERFKQDTQFSADPTLSAGEQYTAADAAAASSSMLGGLAGFGSAAPAPARAAMYARSSGDAYCDMDDSAGAYLLEQRRARDNADQSASVGIVRNDGGAPTSRHQIEFLSQPSILLCNLKPDLATGTLRVPLSSFNGAHNQVSIIALDSYQQGASFRVGLKDAAATVAEQHAAGLELDEAYRDTRLIPGLDSAHSFSEHYLISLLPAAGELLVVEDIKSSTVESYDSLGDYFVLLRTLATKAGQSSIVSDLQKLEWIVRWDTLSPEAQDSKYSEHSCHELNLWLLFKDPAFFRRVVAPFLSNKLQKTFVDCFLLGHDLSAYLAPHAFQVLNTAERLMLATRLQASANAGHKAAALSILDLVMSQSAASFQDDPAAYLAYFKTALQCKSLSKKDDEVDPILAGASRDEGGKEKKKMMKGMAPREQMAPPPPAAMMMMKSMAFGARGGAGPASSSRARRSSADDDADLCEDEEEECSKEEAASFGDYAQTLDANGLQARKLYQAPPSTKEFEERGWFSVSSSDQTTMQRLTQPNRFYSDYAAHLKQQWISAASAKAAFLTKNLGEPLASLTDALLRLTLLDLPMPSAALPHAISGSREKSMTLKASGPTIVFHRELRVVTDAAAANPNAMVDAASMSSASPSAAPAAAASSISISASYFDPFDLFVESVGDDDGGDGERQDKFIDEFLTNKVRRQLQKMSKRRLSFCVLTSVFSPSIVSLSVAQLYGCRVVLTNVSSNRQSLELLLQLPQGSIAVGSFGKRGLDTKTTIVEIGSYSSAVQSYLFYFPSTGTFPHYPPSATKKGRLVGAGVRRSLRVVSQPSAVEKNLRDWKQLSQTGSNAEVLEFLRSENLLKVQLSLMCWRFSNTAASNEVAGDPKAFFAAATAILRARLMFDRDVWSFAFLHRDSQAISELLQRSETITQSLGFYFSSQTVRKDAAEYEWNEYTHLEYSPLLNARAHTLRTSGASSSNSGGADGKKSLTIQNLQFSQQYKKLLQYLSQRVSGSEHFTVTNKLSLCYYLLLQDRITDAQKVFAELQATFKAGSGSSSSASSSSSSAAGMNCALQMDYLSCYMAFFSSDPSAALAIAKRHTGDDACGVSKKRKLFLEVEQQIMELSSVLDPSEMQDEHSKDPSAAPRDNQDREREMTNLAASEPSLDLQFLDQNTLEISYENCRSAQLGFFAMSIELMFSQSPFLMSDAGTGGSGSSGAAAANSFLFVKPNLTLQLTLPPSGGMAGKAAPLRVPIPEQFRQQNCWIELTNAGGSAAASSSGSGVAAAGAGGLSVVKPHFAHQLHVQLTPSYGQVKVSHATTGKPLPATYIKIYSRPKDGSAPSFYKDGYTVSATSAHTAFEMLWTVARPCSLLLPPFFFPPRICEVAWITPVCRRTSSRRSSSLLFSSCTRRTALL